MDLHIKRSDTGLLYCHNLTYQVNMSSSSMTTAWRRVARQQSGYNELFSPSIADTKTTILWYFQIFLATGTRTAVVSCNIYQT